MKEVNKHSALIGAFVESVLFVNNDVTGHKINRDRSFRLRGGYGLSKSRNRFSVRVSFEEQIILKTFRKITRLSGCRLPNNSEIMHSKMDENRVLLSVLNA